jgi:hypothetical protein
MRVLAMARSASAHEYYSSLDNPDGKTSTFKVTTTSLPVVSHRTSRVSGTPTRIHHALEAMGAGVCRYGVVLSSDPGPLPSPGGAYAAASAAERIQPTR